MKTNAMLKCRSAIWNRGSSWTRRKTFWIPRCTKSLKQHQVSPEEYEWYCKMKQLYPLKTSGYGLGIERYLLWVLNHNDIRDCQLLPRFNGENIIP